MVEFGSWLPSTGPHVKVLVSGRTQSSGHRASWKALITGSMPLEGTAEHCSLLSVFCSWPWSGDKLLLLWDHLLSQYSLPLKGQSNAANQPGLKSSKLWAKINVSPVVMGICYSKGKWANTGSKSRTWQRSCYQSKTKFCRGQMWEVLALTAQIPAPFLIDFVTLCQSFNPSVSQFPPLLVVT